MRRFAFFLSCEEYKNYTPTPFCHADAELLKNTLIEKCDYEPENSLMFKLAPDDDIDKKKIITDITDLVGRAEDGDSILFFFAGHGISRNSETYLVLPDTSPFDEVNTALKLSDISYFLSKNKRLNIRIFDCCHSGEGSRGGEPDLAEQEFVQSVLSDGNDCSITLASCAAHEKSYPDEGLGQGIFTYSLVNAIKSYPEDSQIFAEKLKLDVCSAVQEWCASRGKSQTPTSNIQISGNIPIAYKKKYLITAPVVVASGFPLSERLLRARKTEVVTEKFYPELVEALKYISNELERHLRPDDIYGLELEKKSPKDSHNIPSFLREKIFDRLKSYKTMHVMEAVREEQPRLKNVLSSIYEYTPEYNTKYYISQDHEMPDSYQAFEVTTDGYLPSSGVFIYICPLQATIFVLIGYYFDKSYNEARQNISNPRINAQIYSMSEFTNHSFLEQINAVQLSYKTDLALEIERRLAALEAESELSKK